MNQITPTHLEMYEVIASVISAIAAVIGLIILFVKYLALRRKEKKIDKLNPSLEVLANFEDVWKKVIEIANSEFETNNEFKLRNIGLDLEKILPYMDKLAGKYSKNYQVNFSYKGLVINPESPTIAPLINGTSNIRNEYVIASFSRLKDAQENYKEYSNIHFEVRSYDLPPVIHGLIINRKHLFLGFTEFKNKKLFGSDCPYIYLKYDKGVVATSHYFSVFVDWFNYYWENGR